MAKAKLLFEPGFQIKCSNGHLIGTIMSNVVWGDRVSDVLIDWELGNEHRIGDRIKPCAACGANWFKGFGVDIEERRT
jgi:hypothetical protein